MRRPDVHAIAEVSMRPIVLVLGLVCLLAAACGGDKASEPESSSAPADAHDQAAGEKLVSSNAVLGAAARNAKAVESFRGAMEMEMDFGAMRVGFEGELLYQAPDASYMTMDMFGQEIEMLIYGANIYMRPPGAGWMQFDLTSVGVDLSQLQSLAENKGFMDLEALSESLGELEQLDDATIDGETYAHYRAEADFADLLEQMPDGFLDPSTVQQARGAVGDIGFEFWIDEFTELPRRFEMSMDMDIEGEDGTMTMAFDFLEYNTPVDIPAEPVGAPSFDPATLGG